MPRISLVVTDVDGTLVNPQKTLTSRAAEAVRRLDAHGIAFSFCSSRPPFGLRMLIEPLRLKLPFGGYNGGTIAATDLSVLEQKLIDPEAARRAIALLAEFGISIWVFTGGQWVITDPAGDHVDLELRTIQTEPTIVESFEPLLSSVSKIVGACRDHERIKACEAAGQAALRGMATVARSQPYYLDFTPHGVDKGRVIDFLAERLGIPHAEIATLGDMGNDVEMFRKAGFAIAMGNATDEVKSLAQEVTLSNAEDGFAAAIDRYILPS